MEGIFVCIFPTSIPSQWERPTISLPWGILQSWKQHCFSRQRLFLSLVEAYTQPRERDEGSFRHMEQNFLILLSDLQLGRQNPRALAEMSVPSVEVYLLLMMAHFHWDSCACIIPKMIQNKKKGKRDRRKIHYHYQREQPILHLDGSSIHMLQNIEFLFC